MGPQRIPTGVFGPLPKETVGLIIGRSSVLFKGLIVYPGIIDSDYTGELQVMASTSQAVVTVSKGQRVAQLLLLPCVSQIGQTASSTARGSRGFGSSDVYWLQTVDAERPTLQLQIEGKTFSGLIDTGADVSVFSLQFWPASWPLTASITHLQGLECLKTPSKVHKY